MQMLRFAFFTTYFFAVVMVSARGTSASEDNVPSAHELVASVIAAMGGSAELERVTNLSFKGDGLAFKFPAKFEGSVDKDGRASAAIDTELYQNLRIIDRAGAWERQSWGGPAVAEFKPHIRELAPAVSARVRSQLELFPFYKRSLDSAATIIREEKIDDYSVIVLRFTGAASEDYYIDKASMLPLRRVFTAEYEDGAREVVSNFKDYRSVGKLRLPFYIDDAGPDVPAARVKINIKSYAINKLSRALKIAPVDIGEAPFGVDITTVPHAVYKEADWLTVDGWDDNPSWGVTYAPTETWAFDLLVNEANGRWMEPVKAEIAMLSNGKEVAHVKLGADALKPMSRYMLSRYRGEAGNVVIRNNFTQPMDLNVDKMIYTLTLRRDDHEVTAQHEIPILQPSPKTSLLFPVRGNFILTSSHDYDDINHKDEASQWGAYDIVVVGPSFEMYRGEGRANENWVTFGVDVIAPADGVVYYSRNDVPDDTPDDLLSNDKYAGSLWKYAGNSITIDHGNGEFSFLCHLKLGSVLVKAGDRVKKGQVIAKLGATMTSGRPHLHYQLQNGPIVVRSDGLPSRFENVKMLRGPQMRPIAFPPKRGGLYRAE